MIDEFKRSMKDEFDMTDLGKMRYFLGVEVVQNQKLIFINQSKYVKGVLERFGMASSKPVTNPVTVGSKISKHDDGKLVDSTLYKQVIGSLMYLNATRPDIAYFVSLVSRFMERPTENHYMAAKRILRYLRGTADMGILYKREGQNHLEAYCDSDYAGDHDDRKNTFGYAYLFSSGAISWSSKKQPIVTLSTTEAEFVAVAYCVCQGIWIKRILEELEV